MDDPVLVRVHKGVGFWDNTRRRVGDTFLVPAAFADNSTWFSRADRPAPVSPAVDRGPTPPGNANAVHPAGSPADLAKKRAHTSSPRKPAVAEGEDGETAQDVPHPSDAKHAETTAITKGKPAPTKNTGPKPSGDAKVI